MATGNPGRLHISVWALLLGGGPRFARDAFGPVVAFYLGWKLRGLGVGIGAASVIALVAYGWERRQARSGRAAALGLGIAFVQAVAGIVSGSVRGYLAPPVIINGTYGLAFLGSVVIGRPLAGVFVTEMYPLPPVVRTSLTFHRMVSRMSLAWAAYLLLRSAIGLLVLWQSSVEIYVMVNLATGIPCTAALMSWSIWYGVRSFRRSAEWGWAFSEAGAP